jgi:signal peptidase I
MPRLMDVSLAQTFCSKMMKKQLNTFLLSLLTPGFGYLLIGDRKSFYKTILVFITILIFGAASRLFTSFWGLSAIVFALTIIYAFSSIHATMKTKVINTQTKFTWILKAGFTLVFLLITGLSFANRRVTMGFDIMSMEVPVMQATILQGDRFLVNTWIRKNQLKKGNVVVHSLNGQKGLYVNRIIAVEGDRIELKEGLLLINGQIVHEFHVVSANATKPESRNMKALIIPRYHYFVMGDYRDASFGDSRFNGPIAVKNIIGKVTDIISSRHKSRIGTTIK